MKKQKERGLSDKTRRSASLTDNGLARHSPRVASLNDSRASPLNDRTAKFFLGVSNPDRTRHLYDLLGEKLAHAGIRLHAGKTRTWNKASERPPNIDDLGDEVWNPEGDQDLGHPGGLRLVCVACNGSPFGGGEPPLEGSVIRSRHPVCMADSPSMRGPQVSSLLENSAPPRQSVQHADRQTPLHGKQVTQVAIIHTTKKVL